MASSESSLVWPPSRWSHAAPRNVRIDEAPFVQWVTRRMRRRRSSAPTISAETLTTWKTSIKHASQAQASSNRSNARVEGGAHLASTLSPMQAKSDHRGGPLTRGLSML